MGATGWQRSVIEGSLRILQSIGAHNGSALKQKPIPRDADRLRFWVREPWPSLKSSSELVAGVAQANQPLTIVSQMGEGGAVFADGMQSDSYSFPAGEKLVIRPAAYKGRLVRNPAHLPG